SYTGKYWALSYASSNPGLVTVRATVGDGINPPLAIVYHVTVWTPTTAGGTTPPPVAATAYPASVVGAVDPGSLTASDGQATLGDRSAPTPPADLGAGIANGQLVLRWNPASDNSGCIRYYDVYVDGQSVKQLGGGTYEYYAGPAAKGDTHSYSVQADDCSGNS